MTPTTPNSTSIMFLLSPPFTDTMLIQLAKPFVTGLAVVAMENDPQYEEHIAYTASRFDDQVRLAIAMHYMITIFAAEHTYLGFIIYYRLGSYVWKFIRFVWEIIQIIADPSHPMATNDCPWNWQREIVVVNGGSSGIGALIANQLADYDIQIVILDVKPPERTTLQLRNVSFYQTNATPSVTDISNLAWTIRQEVGYPTVLVNNIGGTGFSKPIFEESEAAIRATFDANTTALLWVKELVPHMVRQNHGHVVTVASFETQASSAGYNCTKAATLAFHEGLKQELKHRYKASRVRTT